MIDTSSLPTDRVGKAEWIENRANEVAAIVRGELRGVIDNAVEQFLIDNALTAAAPEPVNAGLDLKAFDVIGSEWNAAVVNVIAPELQQTYSAGAVTAWLGAFADVHDSASAGRALASIGPQWSGVVNEAAESYMRGASNRLVRVGQTTWQRVRTKITQGVRDGLTNEQLKDSVQQLGRFSEFRADTIARTETVGAYVQGDMAGAEALGPLGPVEKVWVAAIDARTRETHIEAHDQVVKMGEQFDVGGVAMNAPHDPAAPAREVVNCRCYVEFLYEGDSRPDGSKAGASPIPKPLTIAPEPERALPTTFSATDGERQVDMPESAREYLSARDLDRDSYVAAPLAKRDVARKITAELPDDYPTRMDEWRATNPEQFTDDSVWYRTTDEGRLVHNSYMSDVARTGQDPNRAVVGGDIGRYRGGTNINGIEWYRGTDDELRQAFREEAVSDDIHQWAITSNDTHPRSLAMQRAAVDEFDLPGGYAEWDIADNAAGRALRENIDAVYARDGASMRQFLRAQYNVTQRELAAQGLQEVTVYRGWSFPPGPGKPQWATVAGQGFTLQPAGQLVEPVLRPLSSTAWRPGEASNFGNFLTRTTVPADRILSTPRTGFGCLGETEVVILHGEGTWTVSGY